MTRFIKLIPPKEFFHFESNLYPRTYLIEQKPEHSVILHRNLTEDEKEQYSSTQLFEYQGDIYIKNIAEMPSIEHAIIAIKLYWHSITKMMLELSAQTS